MSAGQRQHDADLVVSLRAMARWVRNRSAKVATLLLIAAERIDDLSMRLAQHEPPPHPDPEPDQIQPASTPAPH